MKTILKRIILLASLFIITISLKAQIDTSTTQKLIQYILQPLDKNQIPTGFLEEYGCPILPMTTFNGILTDSNKIDMNLWRTMYLQLQTGWVKNTTNPLPSITSVNTTIKQNISNSLPIPIPLLIGQYDVVRSDAFSSSLLSYNSSTNQVYDVPGRPQSPYDTKNLFAACPNKNKTLTGTETFIIPSALIWNNTNKTVSQVQVDFANGQGFQTIIIGSPITVNYTDTGYKRWTIKTTLSDNSVVQCYSDYQVIRISNVSRFGVSEIPAWGIIDIAPGVHSGAIIRVSYSNRGRTNTLRKPLIIVEGYDASSINRAPNLVDPYRIGEFIDGLDDANLPSWNFNAQLDDEAGYDLVFLDFNDGADDILRNAAIVQEVINRVNANKVLDDRFGNIRQENVVMGISMGGLCARYALANMTKNFPGTPTETRLVITHDSPHQGANVPLGLQYLLRMVGEAELFGVNVRDVFPDYNEAIGLLDAPATGQLLTYRSLTANTFTGNTFLNTTYRNMITFAPTDPQPAYRFIATSLGNECANQLYAPYTKLLNISLDGFIFYVPLLSYRLRTIAETYALPVTGNTNKIAKFKLSSKFRLFGLITISRDFYDNTAYAPGNHLATDGVPGAVTAFAATTIPSINFLFPIPGVFGFWGYISANTSGTPGNFSFVSTASALDASPYSTPVFSEKYVNGTNQNFPSTSETFIAQETNTNTGTSNNVHIRFTARNSRWLFNEMENLPNLENCAAECSNPYYISGLDLVCTSATYRVPGLQRGVTISWSVSPAGLATISGTDNLITLTRNGTATGILTLTANLGAGCTSPQSISKQISIGSVVNGYYSISSNYHQPIQRPLYTNNSPIWLPANQSFSVSATITNQITGSSNWTRESSSFPFNWSSSGAQLFFSGTSGSTSYNQRNGIFNFTANTGCGSATTTFTWPVIVQGWGRMSITASPNPATDNINITFLEPKSEISPNINQGQELKPLRTLNSTGKTIVTLFEFNTSLQVRQWTQNETSSKGYNYSVAGLRKGIYILQVDRNNQTTTTKIIVE